jgi:hypothetical protein
MPRHPRVIANAVQKSGQRNDRKQGAEEARLAESTARTANWKRWGPYLSERQWGTVREDYSASGDCWHYFPHDHARSRAYRWGEDGLLGICDRECRLCLAIALWNGRDPILKERLFGVSGPEGNHGEDVKECYFYLDSSPTHAYLKALYKYPQAEFPYTWLVEESQRRTRQDPEFELIDTGIFNENRYFDVQVEYAKQAPDDLLMRITVSNRGPEDASLVLVPTLWFRNTWSWGSRPLEFDEKPQLSRLSEQAIQANHCTLGRFLWTLDRGPDGQFPELLFTENETNSHRLFNYGDPDRFTKDAFHEYIIQGRESAVNPAATGTKAGALYRLSMPAGESQTLQLRLTGNELPKDPFGGEFGEVFKTRVRETDEFYSRQQSHLLSETERSIARQSSAGLLWSKQFYYYIVSEWRKGDPGQPPPPPGHRQSRNTDWKHLYNRDVISMPDKWEYPWYAAWDLAFHMLVFAHLDSHFAKEQLNLFLREWYMHPNGQLPAYEFAFSDVNPPVHAWACWRVYKLTGERGSRDIRFLKRCFHKLLLSFTWWVNRKDPSGKNLFSGGFLGLDNIGVFDRSQKLPQGQRLEQSDGTAWMAFFCATMLSMALELANDDDTYEDIASKFFDHFVAIVDAMNTLGGTGLWDEADGFYYDVLRANGSTVPLRIRSIVGIIPLFAVEILEQKQIDRLPGFKKRMEWFLRNRADLNRHIAYCPYASVNDQGHRLLAIPSRERLLRMLKYVLDEREFLSPYGVRSLSRFHQDHPFTFDICGQRMSVNYAPGESTTALFGGNSNWRGPVWLPINYLLVEALERYEHFYGDSLKVECPTGSGQWMNLRQVARHLARRVSRLFLPDEQGYRPINGGDDRYAKDPNWRDYILFYEYFHGENGRGLGASHQTGWTSLINRLLLDVARER